MQFNAVLLAILGFGAVPCVLIHIGISVDIAYFGSLFLMMGSDGKKMCPVQFQVFPQMSFQFRAVFRSGQNVNFMPVFHQQICETGKKGDVCICNAVNIYADFKRIFFHEFDNPKICHNPKECKN